jgi:DNA polymerase I-like protein with 3'-5' exonuclease and polymerase domains
MIEFLKEELLLMANKEFIYERIRVYAGKDFDPTVDGQVADILRSKFNIYLPQRTSMNDSLASTNSDHEILGLILQYRAIK